MAGLRESDAEASCGRSYRWYHARIDGSPRVAQVVPSSPGRDAITAHAPPLSGRLVACVRPLIQGKPSVSWGRKATGLDFHRPVSRVADVAARRSGNMRIRSVVSHSGQAVLEGALIATLVVGLMAGTAFAGGKGGGGKPGGGATGGSSLAVSLVTDVNGDGIKNWNDSVTFTVTTSQSQPSVTLECSQAGVVVYRSSAGFYPDYPWKWAQTFPLASGVWTGGAADCSARLYYFNGKSYPT